MKKWWQIAPIVIIGAGKPQSTKPRITGIGNNIRRAQQILIVSVSNPELSPYPSW